MNNIIDKKFWLSLLIYFLLTVACNSNNSKRDHKSIADSSKSGNTLLEDKPLIVKGDSIQIHISNKVITFPKTAIDNLNNCYKGIYSVKNSSLTKTYCLQIDDLICFTTYSDVGTGFRGKLYIFNTKLNKFLLNVENKNTYIFSSAGIFFIDKNYVSSFDKSYYSQSKNSLITTVEIYKIFDDNFKYNKFVYEKGDFTYENSSIMHFYNKNLILF